jgi:hypothetical protein
MDDDRKGYMPDRISVPGIGAGALLIAGAIALGVASAFFVQHIGSDGRPLPPHAAHPGKPPPIAGDVELQPSPGRDIATLREEKQRILSSYGWVDRDRGIAHIPIDRAIVLLARRANSGADAK